MLQYAERPMHNHHSPALQIPVRRARVVELRASVFSNLPVEIVELILRFAASDGLPYAHSLLFLNRTFHILLEPVLYSRVAFLHSQALELFSSQTHVFEGNKLRIDELVVMPRDMSHPHEWGRRPHYIACLKNIRGIRSLTLDHSSLFLQFVLKNLRPSHLDLLLPRISCLTDLDGRMRTHRTPIPINRNMNVTHLRVRLGEWDARCFNVVMAHFPNLLEFHLEINSASLPREDPTFEVYLRVMLHHGVSVTIMRSPQTEQIIHFGPSVITHHLDP
ncbi:hypothetical protein SISSUDRAFT_1130696 [Sistotremastrum suecicum HHB10207 ss-3]|uniref:F-box domain-containing protein n=1 Tax=Sistotremastrum suecicum HHB10207 ss-3 TaxID=1314776 RepID=A0A166B545_9AGAM|nr:hypothetical protein SISSUDRAFT_1130696 [Sistotremastrum suecicum HHB10207 ss-3]